jgi:hypothetical protein
MNIKDEMSLNTGDILLFRGTGIISKLLEYFGVSKYSHVGIVLKNPSFINPELQDGIYILESGFHNTPDIENNKLKKGVQIHHIDDVLKEYSKGTVYVRKLYCERNDVFYKKLNEIHKEIHDKPYDLNICDWIYAKYNLTHTIPENSKFRTTKSFWCSALVSYILCELGVIDKDINWSLIAPREFSSDEGNKLKFLCKIDNEINIY